MDSLAVIGKRFEKWRESSPLLLSGIATLFCLPLILAVVWWGTGVLQHQRVDVVIQRDRVQLERQISDTESDLEDVFGQARNLASWVAEEGHALRAVHSPAEAAAANRFLHKLANSFGVDLIYVMNAKGISVAASNADEPDNAIGGDFSNRTHFKMAMSGLPGYQFAMGRTTGMPGFFFSMPLREGRQIVGIVGVKIDQPHLQRLVRLGDALISDDYGVIVLADNPKFVFDVIPAQNVVDKLTTEQRHSRYSRDEFLPLPLQPAGLKERPDVMLLDGAPVLVGSRTLIDVGLTVHAMMSLEILHDARHQRGLLFIAGIVGLCGLVWSLWVGLFYFLHAHDYRRRLELANVRLSELNLELNEQATQDFLTGCLNRRAFSTLLQAELKRMYRYGGDLSLCMIDIDHFKRVNDTLGHDVGDAALKFLVDALHRQMRRTDILARYGGEEFVLLMPNTPADEAVLVVDRMRQSISEQPVPGLEPKLRLTFSAGVMGWQADMNEQMLVSAADQALYAAKDSGRNRVVLGQP